MTVRMDGAARYAAAKRRYGSRFWGGDAIWKTSLAALGFWAPWVGPLLLYYLVRQQPVLGPILIKSSLLAAAIYLLLKLIAGLQAWHVARTLRVRRQQANRMRYARWLGPDVPAETAD